MTPTDRYEHGGWRRRHRRRMRQMWPGGLAGRVGMLLILGLLALPLVAAGLYLHDRTRESFDLFTQSIASQVASIVILVEQTPADERAGVLRAVNGPLLRVRLSTTRPPAPPPDSRAFRRAERAKRAIGDHLLLLGDRPVQIVVFDRESRSSRESERWGDVHRVGLSVGLGDGSWLIFTHTPHRNPFRWGARLVWLILTAVIVVVFGIWAAHRMTKPLRRFAEAADRLGVDVRAPPLPETGSRELRKATAAFNRMQERLRRFVDDRTLMLAAISHDLRTVLTRLRLRAEFIEDAEQQRKAIADVDEMQTMLDSTLSFAREDTREEPRTRIDLAGLLQSLCDDMADAGQAAAYEGPERLTYECRPVALRRAFGNLIGNAVAYGREATVTLMERAVDLEITVGDRGPGIPEELREKVFTPFFRVEGSRSRETGGTGLGLSVARSAVRRHGGDVTLEDRPGGGLLVRVTLPRLRA